MLQFCILYLQSKLAGLPAKPKLARGLFARHSDARLNPVAISSELSAASIHPCTSSSWRSPLSREHDDQNRKSAAEVIRCCSSLYFHYNLNSQLDTERLRSARFRACLVRRQEHNGPSTALDSSSQMTVKESASLQSITKSDHHQ